MKLHLQQEIQNCGIDPPISYKPDVTVNKKLESKYGSLKVDKKDPSGKSRE